MAADEPPYLTVGTDVSAKYKGAFCEAKIKKVNRVVKCKITFKNNMGSFMVTDDQIKGPLRIGADIEAKHPEKNLFFEAIINKLQDYSQYTVVFDDGDETTLRRTSLCLKSGRHFAESPTLDQFPLTNPEHFGTPVIGSGKYKRKRRSTMNSSLDYESSDDDAIPRKLKAIRGKERDPDLGKVVCVDYGDRRKKDSWYPGLIVPHPAQSSIKISKEEHLIRSFKDGKYYRVPKRDTREFVKEGIQKIENNSLRTAIEKAVLYLEKEELPPHWDKALFMGLDSASADEDSRDSDSDSSDDEPSEEKDRFVAQLYKFMDERGTPINKAPTVSNKDLNLYKLFKIMHKLGGYNKVTNKNKWKAVYLKMGLPSSNVNGPNQIKFAYKRYLQSFEDFYRKLGCTMVNNSRSTRGRHRSDRNFIITRTRDRDTASPKGRNSKEFKDKPSNEKKSDEKTRSEKKDAKADETSKSDDKPKSPEKKKGDRLRSEDKDDKKKKEEKPRLVRSQSLNKDKKESNQKDEEKKDPKPEKARTREDARKEKNESPEKKGTRSTSKLELERKEREEALKDKKEKSPKEKEKKDEKPAKEAKDEKGKDKKEEKSAIKDRKPIKDKKIEEKVVKEKRENPVREKREVVLVKDKRDSSKEPKEDKVVKGKKEDNKTQSDDKPPLKKKLERLAKEKKEEKVIRSRRDDKSPSSEVKKSIDESDLKVLKEEKQSKNDVEVKKEDVNVREKPKLRERREDTPFSEEGDGTVECDVSDDKDGLSQDSLDKRGPGSRLKGDDSNEPPNKVNYLSVHLKDIKQGKRRSLKGDDKDEKESLIGLSDSDDESFTNDSEKVYNKDMKHAEIEIGDRVKVKYGRGRVQKVYEAKVLRIEADGQDKRYFVHYAGWNMRYDEWVRRNFIVANLSNKQKQENSAKQNQPSTTTIKKVDKGRPPGVPANAKPVRKNSTSSTNSSLSCSRATRSDKKSLNSPLSSGLEPRKRTRKKSGVAVGLADTSQESESDGEDQDLEDEEVDDADVEDNTTNQMDCCFKEELFSDDEEKEKLEDVKRGDITELEKAISVEEGADDIKGSFFGPILERNSFEDKVIKEENTEVIEPLIIKEKECPLPDIKKEKEKCENAEKVEKSVDAPEKDSKPIVSNASMENKSSVDIQMTTAVNKKFSDIIKPAKIIFPVPSSIPEIRIEKASLAPLGINPLPCNLSPPKKMEFTPKSNYISSAPSLTENRSALSFAGLQGLIQKSAFEKSVTPEKILPKDISCKPSTDTLDPISPPKIVPRADLECKVSESKISPELKPEKVMPVFGPSNILSSSHTSETVLKCEETSKISGSIFSCIVKTETEKQLNKSSSNIESGGKVLVHDLYKEKKVDNERDASHILKSPDSKGSSSDSPTFKHSIISPAKFCGISTESAEKKPKDNFDLLMQNSQDNVKFPDIKDNIFSLSFSHTSPKEKFTLDQPYNKLLALSAENLCRIKPKPSETVDLSKTIPGILERLKKDVVADLKITDSPPPQKEELNFDFLKSSQDTIKCLSRSDSSNSLRICEDMSDTNDSNLDSKELIIIGEKCNSSVVLPSLTENILPPVKENTINHNSELIPTFTSLVDKSIAAEREEVSKNSQKTSVITVATPLPSASVMSSVDPEKSPDTCKDIPDSNIDSKNELDVLKAIDLPTSKSDSNLNNNELSSATDLSVPDSDEIEKNNDTSVKNPTVEVSDVPIKTESKDSLFDDLLKIKNSNFTSNSVIKHTPEPLKGGIISSVNPETPVAVEKEESNIKEECSEPSKLVSETLSQKDNLAPKMVDISVTKAFEEDKSDSFNSNLLSESKSNIEDNVNPDEDGSSVISKREGKKKKLGKKFGKKFGSEGFENEKDSKTKEGKSKSKKRARMEGEDAERSKDSDFKSKSKKIKKNKNKKRFAKHEDQTGEHSKKLESKEDDHKDMLLDKVKRKEKRKSDKKFLKCGIKSDDFPDTKNELPKKKKGKKNRDKLGNEKKDFSEKKTKKKRKLHLEDTQDTDSEKDSTPKVMDKKKKKDRKKFKVKDCSSSDDAGDKCFREQNKEYLPSASETLLRQDSKSDDPDMSFLLCEEKVPASPVGNLADDTSGSSSIEGNGVNAELEGLPLPNSYPCIDNIESDTLNKHSIDTSAVLDNTPPTTPSSTESLLSSSPSHERDSFSLNYPESTQSGRDSGEGESDIFRCNPNRTVVRGSDEYHAATTLAFAVCKSVSEKPKDDISHNFMKRQKIEADDHSPSKRKKKSKRIRRSSESAKSPRHKSSLPRMSKIESCCEDSSGASPATSSSPPYGSSSTLSFTRCSPHRLSCVSDGLSRYNFYVPLHDKDPEKRIAALQEKMAELRKAYMALRAEVIAIDHKRRRARKKVRDAAGAASTNPSVQSEEGQNCS